MPPLPPLAMPQPKARDNAPSRLSASPPAAVAAVPPPPPPHLPPPQQQQLLQKPPTSRQISVPIQHQPEPVYNNYDVYDENHNQPDHYDYEEVEEEPPSHYQHHYQQPPSYQKQPRQWQPEQPQQPYQPRPEFFSPPNLMASDVLFGNQMLPKFPDFFNGKSKQGRRFTGWPGESMISRSWVRIKLSAL